MPGKLPESKIIIVDVVDAAADDNDGEKDDDADDIAVDVREEVADVFAAAAAVVAIVGIGVGVAIGVVVGIISVAAGCKTEIKIYERQLEKILYEQISKI